MFVQKVEYIVSTLSKPDTSSIEKINEQFNTFNHEIRDSDPDFATNMEITPYSCQQIKYPFQGKELDLCRLKWIVEGEKDTVEKFFKECKNRDRNPYRYFRIEETIPFSRLVKIMTLHDNKEVEETIPFGSLVKMMTLHDNKEA